MFLYSSTFHETDHLLHLSFVNVCCNAWNKATVYTQHNIFRYCKTLKCLFDTSRMHRYSTRPSETDIPLTKSQRLRDNHL